MNLLYPTPIHTHIARETICDLIDLVMEKCQKFQILEYRTRSSPKSGFLSHGELTNFRSEQLRIPPPLELEPLMEKLDIIALVCGDLRCIPNVTVSFTLSHFA